MAIAGFFWGYLAALTPGLDFLQPGRHTYAFYSVLSLAAGWFLSEWGARLRSVSPIGPGLGLVALVLIAGRLFGPTLANSVESRLRAPAMLSSEPTDRLRFVLDEVKKHLRAGDRLLYEESGFSLPGIPDPYSDGRYSGLLPYLTGIEVVGGPYLHSAVVNNFTQFGEGRLFGLENWSEPDFLRYARLYRPRAILCWSPRAVRFCRSHPELIEIRAEDSRDLPFRDPRSGRVGLARSELLFGIVRGFEGATIDGEAAVDAEAGRLVVRSEAESSEGASELDAPAVLRYHYAPYLRSTPPVRLEPVLLESDPVPFIRLSPSRTGQPQIIMLDTPP
jgi:hypothetical protein